MESTNKPINKFTIKGKDVYVNYDKVINKPILNGHTLMGEVTLTKIDVGLSNVDNTSDMNKPISNAAQAALDLKEDKENLKALAYKDSLDKSDVGLSNVNNVGITVEEVQQININKSNIETLKNRTSTAETNINNAQATANEALVLAQGRTRGKVFETREAMRSYLTSASSSEFKLGDNLYIKEANVPDYWISSVYATQSGQYGYYSVTPVESGKVALDGCQSEDLTTIININGKEATTVEGALKLLNEEKLNNNGIDFSKLVGQETSEVGWNGTVVPNTDYVENVYFNTSLSVDEVVNIVNSLDLIQDDAGMYGYSIIRTGNDKEISIANVNGSILIAASNASPIFFCYPDLGFGINGWNTEYGNNNPFIYDGVAVSEVEGRPSGNQNNKLVNLLSITPFTYSEGGTVLYPVNTDGSLNKSNPIEVGISRAEVQSMIDTSLGDLKSILEVI
jgi:hypothetical protein